MGFLFLILIFMAVAYATVVWDRLSAESAQETRSYAYPALSYGPPVPSYGGGVLAYRTRDNTQDYWFDFVYQPDGTIRIYILSQPGYGNRSDDSHPTHRLYDNARQQHYICIQEGLDPTNMEHAQNWTREWAESTEKYRRFGTRF